MASSNYEYLANWDLNVPKTQSNQPRRTRENVRQNTMQMKTIQERRRKSSERRRNEAIAQFPIITTQGICVRCDRRKIPDRRISNIIVRETYLNEEVFDTLFSNYLNYKERLRLLAARSKSS